MLAPREHRLPLLEKRARPLGRVRRHHHLEAVLLLDLEGLLLGQRLGRAQRGDQRLHGERTVRGDAFGDLPAQRAYDLGLVNHVVPDGQALAKAKEIAERIAANGPLAVKAIKQAVVENLGLTIKDALAHELELAMPVFMSKDAREGPRAFKEKRPPKYEGR